VESKPSQEHFKYRRVDTMELLSDKQTHETYIYDCIINKS